MTTLTSQPINNETIKELASLFESGEYELVFTKAREALKSQPHNGALWKLKGSALYMLQRDPIYALRHADELLPDDPEAHNSLGAALHEHGDLTEAEACYKHAVEQAPQFLEAIVNLGSVLWDEGKLKEAEAWHRHAVQLTPADAELHWRLANCMRANGNPADAIGSYKTATDLRPDFQAAYNDLGLAQAELGQLDEAICAFQKAIELAPKSFAAWSNLGCAWMALDQMEAAEQCCQKAIDIQPNFAIGHNNLGTVYKTMGQLQHALKQYSVALAVNPHDVESHRNVALVLSDIGNLDDSRRHLEQALALEPDNATTRYAKALICLEDGDLNAGWHHYEARWAGAITPAKKLDIPHPVWQGESLRGKTLLVWGEQGVGDQILFSTMLSELASLCGRCLVACTDKLLPLLARSLPGIEFLPLSKLVAHTPLAGIDVQCPMGSLARWLRPTRARFPAQAPLLVADKGRVAYWKARLAALGQGPKIGICWRSANVKGERRLQFSSLGQWGPILAQPGVTFINLQNGDCALEVARAQKEFGIQIHSFPELDLQDDMDDTAALMSALDRVIGTTTAMGRLGAAVGTPTWALRYGPGDWTSLGAGHNPWLPAFRYFTRTWDQGWDAPIAELAAALTNEAVPDVIRHTGS